MEGRALQPLRVGEVALLPAASIAPPPSLGHVPAFDRAHLAGLEQGRSYSIGTASRGYLVGAVELVERKFLKERPSARRKDALWGTDELVGLVERAAGRVAERWPGSVMYAGDYSARHGGDLVGHASHNSGRDADLAFYMRDDAGRMADSPRMLPIGPDGTARWDASLRFDVARNWAFVAALVRDPATQVQYVFVARHLEALLVAHAEEIGVDETVLARAKAVMREPVNSSNHEEHFHLRLYCALEERVNGCVDFGVVHDWVDTYDRALAERVAEVLPLLRTGAVDEVLYAITRIVRLRVTSAVEHLEPLTHHSDPRIAAAARDAVEFLEGRRVPPRWAHLTEEDPGD